MTRWLQRLPLLRVYPALQQTREQLRDTRAKVAALKADLGAANTERTRLKEETAALTEALARASARAARQELALGSLGAGDLQMLAAPGVDPERLAQLVRDRASTYRTAEPFPHLVEDGLFAPPMLERVLAEFDAMDRGGWHRSEGSHERKWSTEDPRQLGPFTSAFIAQLNGGPFVGFLEELTGIPGLVSDPHLRGGGLHEIRQGGLLGVHADFNIHPRLKLYRRLNLLIYLNKDWEESWGGALELWDRSGKHCVRAIPPVFNRAVLFDTSNFSYHGHPHPLACPPDRSRKSVALYYYSLDCPAEADREAHSTIFLGRDVAPA